MALDLEGVLVNTSFPRELGFGSSERLRRPIAQELLDMLDFYAERLVIWTAAYGGIEKEIVDSAGLKLPNNVKMINRRMYIQKIIQIGILALYCGI